MLEGGGGDFVADIVDWSMDDAGTARSDHSLFVDASRAGEVRAVTALG